MTRWSALLVGVIVLTACGGGAGSGPAATLDVVDTNAEVTAAGSTEAVLGEDGDPLAIGDTVRTDRTGFAQIAYVDGSLTRLDRETEFRVVALGDAPETADVQVSLEAGRVWNRVKELGADARFEVQTAGGTAAVRGTAFDIDCAFGCLFRVLEGQVDVAGADGANVLLDPGQAVRLDDDGTLGPVLLSGETDLDPWFARNIALDSAAGFADLPQIARAGGNASIAGIWDVRFTSTDASTDPTAPPGFVSDVTFTIELACDAGPCDGVIDGGQAGTFDLQFADAVYLIDDQEQTTTVECQPQPVFDRHVTGTLTVSAVLADDTGRAVGFVGTVREEFEALPDAVAAGCADAGTLVRDSVVRAVLRG